MAKNDNERVQSGLEVLRGMIRKLRGGMQTHEVQDAQLALIRQVDTVETDLRISKD